MQEDTSFDYYYGDESEQFSFFRIPRQLITGEKFHTVSTDAKLLYGMLLDRMELSRRNGWYDEQGRVYIYYTVEEIRADMNCGNDKALKLLAELDDKKGIGLIKRIKQGQGKPTKIFVRRFTTRSVPPVPERTDPPRSPDLGFSDFKTSKNQTSRPRLFRGAEIEKSECNYTDLNQTERSYTDPPISAGMDRWELVQAIKENIGYDVLLEQYDREDLDCLVELMADILDYPAPTLRIGSTSLPAKTVKSRFWKLDQSHIEYVLDALKSTTSEIHNIRAYLLTALYNAPATIGPYYATKVRHDLS